jgi:hypothetical protein
LRRALAPFPPNTYSSAVNAATRTENEDKIRSASEAVHPIKQILAKRPSEQQWDKEGKRTRIDTTKPTVNEIICRGCKKRDTRRRIVGLRLPTGDVTIVEIPLI